MQRVPIYVIEMIVCVKCRLFIFMSYVTNGSSMIVALLFLLLFFFFSSFFLLSEVDVFLVFLVHVDRVHALLASGCEGSLSY